MNILVIDNCEIFRRGIKSILEDNFKIDNYHEADNYPELLKIAHSINPDIIIMDIDYPNGDGLDTLKYIKGIHVDATITVITGLEPESYAIRAFKIGASGFLSKKTSCSELVEAVKTILSGKKYIKGYVADYLTKNINNTYENPLEVLSDREHYVFMRIAEGKAVSEIGKELSLSVKTVSHYRKNILVKLGLKNNASIMRYGFVNKIVK